MKHAILIVLLVAAGCGGAKSQKAPMHDLDGPRGHDPRIEDLDRQIAEQMAEIGLAPPTDEEMAMASWQAPDLTMGSLVDACEAPPTGEACADVCTTGDLICDNATSICELADDLPGDDWAAERCAAGKESCDRARERCCTCAT